VDCYGNFLIEISEHHVFLDDRSFFSKIMWGDRLKTEKDAKIEAFSKPKYVLIYYRNRKGDSGDRDV
jgi:hypothetical protein